MTRFLLSLLFSAVPLIVWGLFHLPLWVSVMALSIAIFIVLFFSRGNRIQDWSE